MMESWIDEKWEYIKPDFLSAKLASDRLTLSDMHKVLGKKEYGTEERKHLPGKHTFCKELEIYLRFNEQQNTNQLKWFYNAEEAFEFGITDK